MSSQMKNKPQAKTKFNFGVHGWLLMLYGVVGFMTAAAFWTSSAQNTAVGVLAEQIGVESSTLLYWCSIAGVLSVVAMLFVGMLFSKYKTRKMNTFVAIATGIALIVYGHITSLAAYVVCYFFIYLLTSITTAIGLPQIYTSYFPTKKGAIMGWATCGASLAALVSLNLLNWLIGKGGWATGTLVFGLFSIAMGLINWFLIPDTPEEMGVLPDNGDCDEAELARRKEIMASPKPVWTVREGMHNKNFWLLPIAYGLLFLVNIGIVSQLVSYEISMGLTPAKAALFMSLMPVFAMPGSVFSGWLDQKIGPRRSGIALGVCFAISTFCGGFLPFNTVTNWLFYAIATFWGGAISNLPQSHACSVFGSRDYPALWARMNPIMALIRVLNSSILAFALANLSGYRSAYQIFMFCAIAAVVMLFFSDCQVIKKPGEKPTGIIK
ncbi:MAG: MFS transporter [Oscillospiraceae bacterium]|nr:MFS transporter [Oscillospiraceae bacterium]